MMIHNNNLMKPFNHLYIIKYSLVLYIYLYLPVAKIVKIKFLYYYFLKLGRVTFAFK